MKNLFAGLIEGNVFSRVCMSIVIHSLKGFLGLQLFDFIDFFIRHVA